MRQHTSPFGPGVPTACGDGWRTHRTETWAPWADGVPEVAMDYCFLSKEEGSRPLTVLVTKDRGSKAIIANPVLCKGRVFEDTVEQAALNIRRFGHLGKVLLKTDNEHALVDLRKGWLRG